VVITYFGERSLLLLGKVDTCEGKCVNESVSQKGISIGTKSDFGTLDKKTPHVICGVYCGSVPLYRHGECVIISRFGIIGLNYFSPSEILSFLRAVPVFVFRYSLP